MDSGDPSSGPRASAAGTLPTELMPVSYLLCVLTGCGRLENSPLICLETIQASPDMSWAFLFQGTPLAPLLVPHNPIRTWTGSLGRFNPTRPSEPLLWAQGHMNSYARDHLPTKFSAGRAHPEGTDRNGFVLSWTPSPSTTFGTQELLSKVDQWINRGITQPDQHRAFHKCRTGT